MADKRGSGLPASIEAAWGLRERPTKGPKRGLSVERIVAAAVAVAETDGLAAVSMTRVASELGTGAMSLYRYVAAKSELLMLMIDAVAVPVPTPSDAHWRAGLCDWAYACLAMFRRHRWILRVPNDTPPITPNQMAWLEAGLRTMRGTGLTERAKMSTIMLLIGYVRNYVLQESDIIGAAQAVGSTPDEAMLVYGQMLGKLIDPRRFPEIGAVIAAGAMDDSVEPPDAEFDFGVQRILDGVEAFMSAGA